MLDVDKFLIQISRLRQIETPFSKEAVVELRVEKIMDGDNSGISPIWWILIALLFISIVGILLIIPVMTFAAVSSAKRVQRKIVPLAQERFRQFIGGEPQFIDVDMGNYGKTSNGTGIAIRGSVVYMMENGVAAEIPWETIRRWNWQVAGHTEMKSYGGGMQGVMNKSSVKLDNMVEKGNAWNKSGFFVSIADIEHPEWVFQTGDAKLLKKWFEIFEQINETGELKPSIARR